MKKLSFALVLTLGLISLTLIFGSDNAHSNSSGAPAGHANDPLGGNKTCKNCHSGPAAANLLNVISSNVPADGYVPGTTYTISAMFNRPGHSKFGFQVTPQNASGTVLGTLQNITTQTQLVGTGSSYITHTSSGTASSSWSFNWIAPAAGSGDVTFYGAFNATNSSSTSSGDSIFLSTLTIQEKSGVSVFEKESDHHSFTVFPNPVVDQFEVSYEMENTGNCDIRLMDINGKELKVFTSGQKSKGKYSEKFSVEKEQFSSGYYLLKLKKDNVPSIKLVYIK